MRGSKSTTSLTASTLTSSNPTLVDGFILVYSDTGLPELEARRMIALDQSHYTPVRTEDRKVYRLAEDFFIHELPARIRVKEVLKAQQYHYQLMLTTINENLEEVDLMIEQARKENK